jgi:hypothetical protein
MNMPRKRPNGTGTGRVTYTRLSERARRALIAEAKRQRRTLSWVLSELAEAFAAKGAE